MHYKYIMHGFKLTTHSRTSTVNRNIILKAVSISMKQKYHHGPNDCTKDHVTTVNCNQRILKKLYFVLDMHDTVGQVNVYGVCEGQTQQFL